MIDLIIPCYNAHDTIERTLCSVYMQTMCKDIHIILVDDNSDKPYDYLKEKYNDLDLEIIRLEKNCGSGCTRRVGMKKGNNEYIMFMDADDTFTNSFAVRRLYDYIKDNEYDCVTSNFLEDLGNGKFVKHEQDSIWVFGKIYKREFLEKNSIYFNDTRANEDTGFNTICFFVGNWGYLNDNTYIWHYKEDSITRRDGGIYRFTGIKGYLDNMEWAVQEIRRIGVPKNELDRLKCNVFIATYFFYLDLEQWGDKRVNYKEFMEWVYGYYKRVFAKEQIEEKIFLEAYEEVAKSKMSIFSKPILLTIKQFEDIVSNKLFEK